MGEAKDVITLRGLSAVGRHGVFDFERSGSQVFTADITLWVDASRAAETDDVQYTVDYAQIADAAVEVLTGASVYLIETLAHRMVQAVLQNPLVQKAEVTIHKPMAPVGHLFEDVSVTLVRHRSQALKMPPAKEISSQAPPQLAQSVAGPPAPPPKGSKRLVLALGSNQGDSVRILSAAVGALIEAPGVEVDDVSPLVVSKPVLAPGQSAQPNYYNAVVLARTVLDPEQVLSLTQSIEAQFGRLRAEKWGPRTLDIDIIDYGGQELETAKLTLPHPRAATRAFVLYPWSLVDEKAQLQGVSVARLVTEAPDYSGLKSVTGDWLLEDPPPLPAPPEPEDPKKPEVQIRGLEVSLTEVTGDSLFQKLLSQEGQRKARQAPSPQPKSPPPRPVPPRTSAVPKAPAQQAPEATGSKPAFYPTQSRPAAPPQPRRVSAGSHRAGDAAQEEQGNDGALPTLPSWRFLQGRRSVRIVDSVEPADAEPQVEPRTKWGRRRVVRPTPTGMISLDNGAQENSADGDA